MKISSYAKLAALIFASSSALHAATVFTDDGSNYTTGSWITGSNSGSGFGAWTLTSSGGSGFAGTFVGDPASSGITGMSTTSFGLYANPSGSGASVDARRSFANPLGVGDSFSFQWGINWDSGSNGAKGFDLYSSAAGSTPLINIGNGGNSDIFINGNNTGFGYGAAAMTWTITRTSATNLQVVGANRDVSPTAAPNYSGNFTVGETFAPDSFKFYAYQLQAPPGAEANPQPYFNNLTITVVPEPSSLSLLALSGLALLRRRRA